MENQQKDQYFNLKQVFLLVLRRWYWVVGCMILFAGIAYVVNHYAKARYKLTSTLQVNKTESVVNPMAFIYNDRQASSTGVEQKVLLTSFPVMVATLNNLDFNISYHFGKRFSLREMYQSSPIEMVVSKDAANHPYGQFLEIHPLNGKEYIFKWEGHPEEQYRFGQEYEVDGFKFTVNVTKPDALDAYEFIAVKLHKLMDLVNEYRNKAEIQLVSEAIMNLSVVEENPQKGKAFLDMWAKKIIEQDEAFKRFVSQKTVQFIDKQMSENYDSIRNIEGEIKTFRNSKVAVNPAMEGERLFGTIKELENERAGQLIAKDYYDYLTNTLRESGIASYEKLVIPSSLGIEDGTLNAMVMQLVDMSRQVKMLLDEKKTKNPLLQENQVMIAELRSNILSNIVNQKKAADLKIKQLNRRIAQNQAQLRQMPDAEFELNDITRTYSLNQNLYMMLMEKKMEAGIKFSSISSDYRVVNEAYEAGVLTSSPSRNYLIALLLSLVIPVGIILLIDFFDYRIKSKEELEMKSPLPIISSIMRLEDKEERYQLASPVTESFRTLRANLRYLGLDKKIFMLTSSVSGEGKTFCSQNLAYLLSITNKKVVLIDADLRKPKHLENKPIKDLGLADYLAGFTEMEEIIQQPGDNANLFFIRSGSLPPNPAELLISRRMQQLIEQLKKEYDYIIIDTPPLNLFADALEILPMVDYTFLLVRNKYTKSTHLSGTMDLLNKRTVKDISVIFNDIPRDKKKRKEYGAYYYNGQNGKSKKSVKKVKIKA